MKAAILAYGIAAYAFFFVTFTYSIGFVTGLVVPKAINDGPPTPLALAILINGLLLAAFAIQHTIMARPAFKRWWMQYVPQPAERTTFVVFATAILAVIMWQWRPLPTVIWSVETTWARLLLHAVEFAGWGLALYSTFLIDHFDLFGLRQVWLNFRGRPYMHRPFTVRSAYRYVRHPLMLGFFIAFWAAPTMTVGRLFFAALITAWVVMGVRLEERDLVRALGDAYRNYQQRTPRFFPWPKRGNAAPANSAADNTVNTVSSC